LAQHAGDRSRRLGLDDRPDHFAPAPGAPLVAEQRRLAEAIFARGRQTIDIRGLLLGPEAPTKIVVGLDDRIKPPHHAEGLSGLIALHRFARIGNVPHLEARREVARLIEELTRAGGR
jgi:pyruvate dehydrogenase E2 component (dihydrolipoamide acetyltransferase)